MYKKNLTASDIQALEHVFGIPKKREERYILEGFSTEKWNGIVDYSIDIGKEVQMAYGSLLDNYLIEDIRLQWKDNDGRHNVHFDYLLILEEHETRNSSVFVGYGIKERGMNEAEKKLLDRFYEMMVDFTK